MCLPSPARFTMITFEVKIRHPVFRLIMLTTTPWAQQNLSISLLPENPLWVTVCTLFILTSKDYCPMQWVMSLMKPPSLNWILSVVSLCALVSWVPRALAQGHPPLSTPTILL